MTEDSERTFPYEPESGSASGDGYSVEARIEDYAEPMIIGDFTVTTKWKRVPFTRAPFGVPNGTSRCLEYTNYLSYPAAQALRWWFHADAEKQGGWLSLRTRIVKYRISVNHKVTAVSVHAEIGGEDRSGLVPDWGTSGKALTAANAQSQIEEPQRGDTDGAEQRKPA